jgi:hypothetical protein
MIKSALALGASFDSNQLNFIEKFSPRDGGDNNIAVAVELKKIYEENYGRNCVEVLKLLLFQRS